MTNNKDLHSSSNPEKIKGAPNNLSNREGEKLSILKKHYQEPGSISHQETRDALSANQEQEYNQKRRSVTPEIQKLSDPKLEGATKK